MEGQWKGWGGQRGAVEGLKGAERRWQMEEGGERKRGLEEQKEKETESRKQVYKDTHTHTFFLARS